MNMATAVSAANRFGLGARPGELRHIDDPQGWLLAQLVPRPQPAAFEALPGSAAYLRQEAQLQRQRAQLRQAKNGGDTDDAAGKALLQQSRKQYRQIQTRELSARYSAAVDSPESFIERLAHFWSNHFAISMDKRPAALYAAPMEREAIRPHLLGRFGDLLLAVETHPGMLRYLDNVRSVGADSTLAQRARRRQAKQVPGLNENLAREILELHTLGVQGGYAQADVIELARAITGWGVPGLQELQQPDADAAATFRFRPAAHEAGPRTLLGKRYGEGGLEQGQRMLADLAVHPATARHVSWKLARHLVGDTPSTALVDAMARTWVVTGADLSAVYRALIEHPAAWEARARKFKTPDDYLVSAVRAAGVRAQTPPRAMFDLLDRMGQPPFTPRSPAGFADEAAEWSGPDALWKRVQAAQALADALPKDRIDPLATAQEVFGDRLDAQTATALRRAESARDGLALLFASPAFQWRT